MNLLIFMFLILNTNTKEEAKIWLLGNTEEIAYSYKTSCQVLRKIMKIIEKKQKFLRNKYQELSIGGKKRKSSTNYFEFRVR
jgi:hypothetical protein